MGCVKVVVVHVLGGGIMMVRTRRFFFLRYCLVYTHTCIVAVEGVYGERRGGKGYGILVHSSIAGKNGFVWKRSAMLLAVGGSERREE